MEELEEQQSEVLNIRKFRKRSSHGRLRDVNKKLKLTTHELGDDCMCKRLKCFQKITIKERQVILNNFNQLNSTTQQNLYLCGLISCKTIQRRRPRKSEDTALLHDKSYLYHVKIKRDADILEIPVCYKAFCPYMALLKRKWSTYKNL
ncbi:unnamed protein product [Psylliodes chrysocephalus]|uniref:Uncharacterized protein n=1 Tax=Psylliodes chrysocephalus TaxID=3402493 RepID=A0A9P0D4T8_9CUCU|nr:unnamed protein product [Psylliodes chrysocephala]